eukprot:1176761-Prorocentrum_minimum.AAC.7
MTSPPPPSDPLPLHESRPSSPSSVESPPELAVWKLASEAEGCTPLNPELAARTPAHAPGARAVRRVASGSTRRRGPKAVLFFKGAGDSHFMVGKRARPQGDSRGRRHIGAEALRRTDASGALRWMLSISSAPRERGGGEFELSPTDRLLELPFLLDRERPIPRASALSTPRGLALPGRGSRVNMDSPDLGRGGFSSPPGGGLEPHTTTPNNIATVNRLPQRLIKRLPLAVQLSASPRRPRAFLPHLSLAALLAEP